VSLVRYGNYQVSSLSPIYLNISRPIGSSLFSLNFNIVRLSHSNGKSDYFQVLTVAIMKMTCLLGCCAVCSSRGAFIALMMKAVITSVTSVNFYKTKRRNNPEDSHLQTGNYYQNVKLTLLSSVVTICITCFNIQ
jgi:hypothetical protein